MTAPIDGAALGHPMASVVLVQDFATTGLVITGLPSGWRMVRRDAEIVTVSDLWVDAEELEQQTDLHPSQRFVSNAMATAWRISELPVPVDHLLQFAEAMTAGTAGWSQRSRDEGFGDLHGSTLFGVLQSPFGGLVSNSQFVVQQVASGEFVVAQLAVTALPHHGRDFDGVRLAVGGDARNVLDNRADAEDRPVI